MLNLIFKSSFYYIIWNKFKENITTIAASLIAIAIIFIIYSDLYDILKVSNKNSLILLFALKWFLVLVIISFNIYKLNQSKPIIQQSYEEKSCKKTTNARTSVLEEFFEEIKSSSQKTDNEFEEYHQEILKKAKLRSRGDFILEKYKKNT